MVFSPFSVAKNITPLAIFLIYLAMPIVNHLKLPAAFQTEPQIFPSTALVPAPSR